MSDKTGIVELGFVEEIESWKLKSKFFPSKVGGLPSWLALEFIPGEKLLRCKNCAKSLVFLCQLYAPITSNENCFHRTVFIFICRGEICSRENDASNISVFRSQLPRSNKYYSFDPPKEIELGSDSPSAEDWVKLCRICGAHGPKICGSCKLVSYCSREHQAADWKAGHKLECEKKELESCGSKGSAQVLFPEFEIDLEPEELEQMEPQTDDEVMKKYEEILKKGQPVEISENKFDEEDLIKMAAEETDKQFARFRSRISEYPNQVIRYDRGGEPLFVSSLNKPENIPPCEICGQARIFEFQIMPQLLVYLKVDHPGKSIDWGTILVYTCPQSCSQEGVTYIPEVVFKQDYSPSTDFLKQ